MSDDIVERLEAENKRLRSELAERENERDEARGDATVLRAFIRIEGCTPSMMAARATLAESRLSVAAEALRIIAGKQQCLDNLMSNGDVARAALKEIEG